MLPTTLLPRLPRSLDDFSIPIPLSSSPRPRIIIERALLPFSHLSTTLRNRSDSGYCSENEDAEEGDDKVAAFDKDDVFERNFARDWLLLLVRRAQECWAEDEDDEAVEIDEEEDKVDAAERAHEASDEQVRRNRLVEIAAALAAKLSQTSDSGDMHRSVLLPLAPSPTSDNATSCTSEPISITLHDGLPSSADPTSVGLQSWGSSVLLARKLALEPERFGLEPASRKRVLELGAGTGLLSIAWAKILERLQEQEEQAGADVDAITGGDEVVATDFHSGVLKNLALNLTENFPSSSTPTPSNPTASNKPNPQKLDWSAVHNSRMFSQSALKSTLHMPPPFHKSFDIIMAADVIYGPTHALWLKSCVEQFLNKPSSVIEFASLSPVSSTLSSPSSSSSSLSTPSFVFSDITPSITPSYEPTFHLFVPLRPTHTEAISTIAHVFPLASSLPPRFERPNKDWAIAIKNVEELERVKGVGRADEQSYRLYEIGWC